MTTFDILKERQCVPDDVPHGWIQWKGTDACVDLHCACGAHGHHDGYSMYHVACTDCGRKYVVGMNIDLIELTPGQSNTITEFAEFCDED